AGAGAGGATGGAAGAGAGGTVGAVGAVWVAFAASSDSRSSVPFLNSREASPRDLASLGSRVVPNNSRTMTRMMISSGAPRLIAPPGYRQMPPVRQRHRPRSKTVLPPH